MQLFALALTLLVLCANSHPIGPGHQQRLSDLSIEQIYPEDWVHELLTHPLRVSIFTSQPDGAIHLGEHRFSDTPLSLTDNQSELASKTFSSPTSYQPNEAAPANPDPQTFPTFMLRFENEQQTVDFTLHLPSSSFHCYINGQHHPESSSPKIILTPAASKTLKDLSTQVIQAK